MSIIAVEINGGENNTIDGVFVRSNNGNSKAVVINNSPNNVINNIQLVDESTVDELKRIRLAISEIQNDLIDTIESRSYQEKIVDKLTILVNSNDGALANKSTARDILSLLSDWITCKNEVAPLVVPFIIFLQTVFGG